MGDMAVRLSRLITTALLASAGAIRCGWAEPGPVVASKAQIVFMAPVKVSSLGNSGYELVTMNLDGSNRRQITDNDQQEFLPHFSPDGTRLVYTKFSSGAFGEPNSPSDVAVYDFATETEANLTGTGRDSYPVWSPNGSRIAFLRGVLSGPGPELWIMNADGSHAHRVATPTGASDDLRWGDIAWSRDNWILFVVAQTAAGCFKTRVDKIRPDGRARTKVSDGGPNCTPQGAEQSGDADPGFSPDGMTIYSSRGFPNAPAGSPPPNSIERRLYSFTSAAWYVGKPETDFSLPFEPSCIEGVPKASPDGTRVLLFRACFTEPNEPHGIFLTDTAGSYRMFITEGFGPDWNPRAQRSRVRHRSRGPRD